MVKKGEIKYPGELDKEKVMKRWRKALRSAPSLISLIFKDGKLKVMTRSDLVAGLSSSARARIAEALSYNEEPGVTYVIGHYHKSFFKPEKEVVLLGAWQTQTSEEEEIDFNPDIMEALLIK